MSTAGRHDPAPARPPRARGRRSPTGAGRARRRRGLGHVQRGDLISAGSGLALLGLLFATAWYGVAGTPDPSAARPALTSTETGWAALSLVRWVILATALVALGAVALHASQRGHGSRTETGGVMLGLGLVTSLLLVWRVLVALPSPEKVLDQKLGAVLGLGCALGIALGGHESLVELRDRRRGDAPPAAPPAAARPLAVPVAVEAPGTPAPVPVGVTAGPSEPAAPAADPASPRAAPPAPAPPPLEDDDPFAWVDAPRSTRGKEPR